MRQLILITIIGFVFSGCTSRRMDGPDSVRKKFDRLHAQWQKECRDIAFSSRTSDYLSLPAFRSIVELGLPVLPYLREKMEQDQGSDFFLAYAVADIRGWKREDCKSCSSEQDFRDAILVKMKSER